MIRENLPDELHPLRQIWYQIGRKVHSKIVPEKSCALNNTQLLIVVTTCAKLMMVIYLIWKFLKPSLIDCHVLDE